MNKFNKMLFLTAMLYFTICPISSIAANMKIYDSRTTNVKAINNITSKSPSETHPLPLGTVVAWFYDFDPPDNNCTSAKTGGDGVGGKCIWLECNGQNITNNAYPEFAKLGGKIPDYRNKMLAQYNAYERIANPIYPSDVDSANRPGIYFEIELPNRTTIAIPEDINDQDPMNGILRIGTENNVNETYYRNSLTFSRETKLECLKDKYGKCLKDENGQNIVPKFIYPEGFKYKREIHKIEFPFSETVSVRYFIRVSHPEPEKE